MFIMPRFGASRAQVLLLCLSSFNGGCFVFCLSTQSVTSSKALQFQDVMGPGTVIPEGGDCLKFAGGELLF